MSQHILEIYNKLYEYFGPQHWWPGDTTVEIIVGAVLTQNTNWTNVTRAIENLKQENLLSLEALDAIPLDALAELIRPSGYYNLKARRLKNLISAISALMKEAPAPSGDPDTFFEMFDIHELRKTLLAVKGIGPETADSIILYAAGKPMFVVDAYTHRILNRHGLVEEYAEYHDIQDLFMDSLPEDTTIYNEYHALLVRLGKEFCKKTNPRCDFCPIKES